MPFAKIPAGGALSASREPDTADFFDFRPPSVIRPFPPRKAFLYGAICLLWAVFGIFGRDPWKPEETILVALVADLARDFSAPLPADFPPLYLYLAAAAAKLTGGFLPAHEGARLANLLLLFGGFSCLWGAARVAYGARAAWLSVLLVVGTVGFMVRAHLLNFGVPAFFGFALALAAAAIFSRQSPAALLAGGAAMAAAAFFLLLAADYWLMLAAVAAAAAWLLAENNRAGAAAAAVFAFTFPALLSPLFAADIAPLVEARQWFAEGLAERAVRFLRVGAWALFPVLPLAAAGVWVERRKLSQAQTPPLARFALFVAATGGALFFARGGDEDNLFFLIAPLALLAGRALQAMSDDYARLLEGFAVLVVGVFCSGGLWLAWGALAFGEPAAVAGFMREWLPHYELPPMSGGAWVAVAAAAGLTAGWFVLAVNFRRSNERAAVNWSCGVTLLWAVFNLLLAGYVDSGKSFRRPAGEVAAAVAADNAAWTGCITAAADSHWRAQLRYFGAEVGGENCPYLFTEEQQAGEAGGEALVELWSGGRAGGKRYYLYRRF